MRITTDAYTAALIESGLAAGGTSVDLFLEALEVEARREGNRPLHFSTAGNVNMHPVSGVSHFNVQLRDPADESRPIHGCPRICGTLSTPGVGGRRMLDVTWVRIATASPQRTRRDFAWLTASVDFDEPRLLLLPGCEMPDTVMQGITGARLSEIVEGLPFAGLDPIVERVARWEPEHVNATTGQLTMRKEDPAALGITLAACGTKELGTDG